MGIGGMGWFVLPGGSAEHAKGNQFFRGKLAVCFRECNYLILKVVFASGIRKPWLAPFSGSMQEV